MKYLPAYYERVKEMNALMDAENPEFGLGWEAVFQTWDSQFILDSDERRVRLWEKLLRLRPDYRARDLDQRKAVVIMRLSSRDKLTHRWLLAKTDSVFGVQAGLAESNWAADLYHNEYMLWIRVFEDPENMAPDFLPYLRKMIPANLGITFGRMFRHEIYTGLAARVQNEHKGRPAVLSGGNRHNLYAGQASRCVFEYKAKY
jgi:hypothetical protein